MFFRKNLDRVVEITQACIMVVYILCFYLKVSFMFFSLRAFCLFLTELCREGILSPFYRQFQRLIDTLFPQAPTETETKPSLLQVSRIFLHSQRQLPGEPLFLLLLEIFAC